MINKRNILAILILPFLLIYCNSKENKVSAQSTSDSEAKVTMVEYSDYQCPACATYYPIVNKLKQHFGEDLKVVYRHFPLNIHQYAALAARAAEAAKKQDAFIEMHNMLFENQKSWANSGNPQARFIGYARELGLDMEQFKEDLNSAEIQRIVMEERKEAEQIGVRSTPTFFINGTKVNNAPGNFEDFKLMVRLYLDEAESDK